MRIPLELCFLVLTVDRFDFQMVSAFNHFGFWDQVLDRKQISAAERAWVPRLGERSRLWLFSRLQYTENDCAGCRNLALKFWL